MDINSLTAGEFMTLILGLILIAISILSYVIYIANHIHLEELIQKADKHEELASYIEASDPISAGASDEPVITLQSLQSLQSHLEEGDNLTKQFTPYTVVSAEAATITTYLADEPYYSERIDEYLTIFWKDTEKTIVGYRLKGVTKFKLPKPDPFAYTEPFEGDKELKSRIDQIFQNAIIKAKQQLDTLNEIIAGK